jgi:hypothetical protein
LSNLKHAKLKTGRIKNLSNLKHGKLKTGKIKTCKIKNMEN